jgi:hypothetical protein
MVLGMWMHTFQTPNDPPFDTTKYGRLYSYCLAGNRASFDALGIVKQMRLIELEKAKKKRQKDEARALRAAAKSNAPTKNATPSNSIWTKKLF